MSDEAHDQPAYVVVINHEEQYSIWPQGRELPAGWKDVGMQGSKEQCLSYIDEHWTDMRPLSVRRAQAAAADEEAGVP